MADNAGKPGGESGYQRSDPPTSDPIRQSTRNYDRGALSRPPGGARRDPRADPDDDEAPAPRVDVVTVDRGSGGGGGGGPNSSIDSLTNAALTLRRELAKLHQQAAAVERTIEDQRRERTDAMERAEHVNSRNVELEQRADTAEGELANLRRLHDQTLADLQTVRSERDDLSRAVEVGKETTADLARARDEIATAKRQHDEIVRTAATFEHELAEIRKREQAGAQHATDVETELQSTRERFERVSAELSSAREEITQTKADVRRVTQEATDAAEAATQKLTESEHERLAAKEQIDRLDKALAEARIVHEKVVLLDADLTTARAELVNARADIGRLERDLEDVRRARDVGNERATMAERETDNVKKEVDRLQQALETANTSAANANAKAVAADRARVAGEEAVRTLRDEITTAFARWRSISPSIMPPAGGSVAPPTRAVPLSDFGIPGPAPLPRDDEPPPATRPGDKAEAAEKKHEPATVTAPPSAMVGMKAPSVPPMPAAPAVSGPPPPPEPELISAKSPSMVPRPASERPSALMRASAAPPPSASMRASRPPSVGKLPSVSPPAQSRPPSARMPSVAPLPIPIEPKTPDLRPSPLPPRASVAPSPPRPSVPPPPIPVQTPRSMPPPLPLRHSVPPAVYPSVPPQAPTGSVTPTQPPPPMVRTEDSSVVHYLSQERELLVEGLGSPKTSRQCAITLKEHPDWLRGRPPIELLLALTHLDYDIEEPVFELARAWDRDPLCRALIAALRDEPEPKLREHGAWLLKHLGAAASWPAIAELVSNEEEAPAVRRWLLEAIERLVAARAIAWHEVGDLCMRLIKHANASLRDGTIGVIAALDRSDDKRRLLLDVLRTDHDEVVLSSAVQALTTALPIELDPSVAERLLGHPSARVQQSVVEFIERSKRAAKNA